MSHPRTHMIGKSHKYLSVEEYLINSTVPGSPQEMFLQVSFSAF